MRLHGSIDRSCGPIHESLTVTYTLGVSVRFDIEGDLTFVQGWLHDNDDNCTTPGSIGAGAELWAEFDLP